MLAAQPAAGLQTAFGGLGQVQKVSKLSITYESDRILSSSVCQANFAQHFNAASEVHIWNLTSVSGYTSRYDVVIFGILLQFLGIPVGIIWSCTHVWSWTSVSRYPYRFSVVIWNFDISF